MIEIHTTIYEQLGGLRARGRKQVMRQLYREMAWLWLNRFFDLHFKPSAFFRYGKTYRKRRSKRSDARPLHESGEMMTRLKLSARVTGTARRAVLHMRGPWYTTAFRRALDKVAELTVVNRREGRDIAKFAARRMPALIRRNKHKKITRVRA